MNDRNQPLVTAAELEALMQDWGAGPDKSIDRFFPLRFWYIFCIAFFYAMWLLFATDSAVQRMTTDPSDSVRMGRFMYFRGWFILGVLGVGCYAYLKSSYPAIFFGSIFLVGSVNFVFDLFNIYAAALARPTPQVTLLLLARLIVLWFLFLSVKNAGRLPNLRDRFNPLLMFKKTS